MGPWYQDTQLSLFRLTQHSCARGVEKSSELINGNNYRAQIPATIPSPREMFKINEISELSDLRPQRKWIRCCEIANRNFAKGEDEQLSLIASILDIPCSLYFKAAEQTCFRHFQSNLQLLGQCLMELDRRIDQSCASTCSSFVCFVSRCRNLPGPLAMTQLISKMLMQL